MGSKAIRMAQFKSCVTQCETVRRHPEDRGLKSMAHLGALGFNKLLERPKNPEKPTKIPQVRRAEVLGSWLG